MTVALVLGAIVAVACVLFVARPFLRSPQLRPEADRLDELDEGERRRLELAEDRDRALAALKELEFDHRTGKVSDDDYSASLGALRRRAAEALAAADDGLRRAGALPLKTMSTPQPPGIPDVPVPEPAPVPHEPPTQPEIPEPYPPPSTPPQPEPVPEPSPVPHEPPQPAA